MTLHSSDCSNSSVGHAGEDHIEGVVVGRISSTYVPIGRLSCRLKVVFHFFFLLLLLLVLIYVGACSPHVLPSKCLQGAYLGR